MTLAHGVLEMVELASEEPKTFTEFTQIEIDGKNLSSATVSKRLEELVAVDVLEEVVTRSETGRRTVGYTTTERGETVLQMSEQLEAELET